MTELEYVGALATLNPEQTVEVYRFGNTMFRVSTVTAKFKEQMPQHERDLLELIEVFALMIGDEVPARGEETVIFADEVAIIEKFGENSRERALTELKEVLQNA